MNMPVIEQSATRTRTVKLRLYQPDQPTAVGQKWMPERPYHLITIKF